MTKLVFDAATVRSIVEHMTAATEWRKEYGAKGKGHPQLVLVHDEGIYVMSNGVPGLKAGDDKKHVVAYAKGYNPHTDRDVLERARDAVGGDDFAEYLTLSANQTASILSGDIKRLEIGFNSRSISLAVITNSPAPTRPATDAEMSKRIQRAMRTRIIFLRDGKLLQSQPMPAPSVALLKGDKGYLALMTQRFRADTILNVLPPTEALALYRKAKPPQKAA
jgi:hypothetical protein